MKRLLRKKPRKSPSRVFPGPSIFMSSTEFITTEDSSLEVPECFKSTSSNDENSSLTGRTISEPLEFPHDYPYESHDGYHSSENIEEVVVMLCQTDGDTPMHLLHRYVRSLRLHLLLANKAIVLQILETDDLVTQRSNGRVLLEKLGLVLYRLHTYPSFQDTLVELEIVDCYYLLIRYPRIRRNLVQTSALWHELLECLVPWGRPSAVEGEFSESDSEEKDAINERFKLNVRLTVFEIFISLFQDASKEQRSDLSGMCDKFLKERNIRKEADFLPFASSKDNHEGSQELLARWKTFFQLVSETESSKFIQEFARSSFDRRKPAKLNIVPSGRLSLSQSHRPHLRNDPRLSFAVNNTISPPHSPTNTMASIPEFDVIGSNSSLYESSYRLSLDFTSIHGQQTSRPALRKKLSSFFDRLPKRSPDRVTSPTQKDTALLNELWEERNTLFKRVQELEKENALYWKDLHKRNKNAEIWEENQRLQEAVNKLKIGIETLGGDWQFFVQEPKKNKELPEVPVEMPMDVPPPPPPPPAMGGPPPPPPPPPMPGLVINKKKSMRDIIKSNKQLKPLEWNKLKKNASESSIWHKVYREAYSIDEEKSIPDLLDEDTLVELFENTKKPTKILSKPAETEKAKIQLLNHKRSRNISIMVKSFKFEMEELARALLTMDSSILTIGVLERLSVEFPTKEEFDLVRAYEGETEDLALAEQFIWSLKDIHDIPSRVESLLFSYQFETEYRNITKKLNTVVDACDEMKKSKKLESLLQQILLLGNFVNGKSFRGEAKGFELESILKIKNTKSVSKRTPTLLHYLAQKLPNDVTDYSEELGNVKEASRVHVEFLVENVHQHMQVLKKIKKQLAQEGFTRNDEDEFVQRIQPFIDEAEPQVAELLDLAEEVEKAISNLYDFFEEDIKQAHPKTKIFLIVVSFNEQLKQAIEDNKQIERRLARTKQ